MHLIQKMDKGIPVNKAELNQGEYLPCINREDVMHFQMVSASKSV